MGGNMSEVSIEPSPSSMDWSTITTTVECPLCRYNLRGLSEPRCPECGCRFEWAEVLDPLRSHPYIFEHHANRNTWSFFRTLWGGLRARRFWTTLRPSHAVMPRRLVFYWSLCTCFVLLAVLAEVMAVGIIIANNNAGARMYLPRMYRQRGLSPAKIEQYMNAQFPLPPSTGFLRQTWHAAAERNYTAGSINVATILLWPWLTLAALMIFQASMKRAKVKRAHVLRCVIYAADASVWYLLALVVTTLVLIIDTTMRPRSFGNGYADQWAMWLVSALWLIRLDRLWTAYKKYLQFDRPFFTALASQILVVLAGAALFFWGGRVVHWMATGFWGL
jgi:hypothetical protein